MAKGKKKLLKYWTLLAYHRQFNGYKTSAATTQQANNCHRLAAQARVATDLKCMRISVTRLRDKKAFHVRENTKKNDRSTF